jgi:hypothetical protein
LARFGFSWFLMEKTIMSDPPFERVILALRAYGKVEKGWGLDVMNPHAF